MFLFSISHLFLSPGSYPRNINPDFWICIFPQNTFHEKKYVALYGYSPTEPGSQMAEHPQEHLKLWELPDVQLLWKSG